MYQNNSFNRLFLQSNIKIENIQYLMSFLLSKYLMASYWPLTYKAIQCNNLDVSRRACFSYMLQHSLRHHLLNHKIFVRIFSMIWSEYSRWVFYHSILWIRGFCFFACFWRFFSDAFNQNTKLRKANVIHKYIFQEYTILNTKNV